MVWPRPDLAEHRADRGIHRADGAFGRARRTPRRALTIHHRIRWRPGLHRSLLARKQDDIVERPSGRLLFLRGGDRCEWSKRVIPTPRLIQPRIAPVVPAD